MIDVSMLFELQKILDQEQESKNDIKRLLRNLAEIEKKSNMTEKVFIEAKKVYNRKKMELDDLTMQLATLEAEKKKYEIELYSPKNANPKYLKDMEYKINEIKRNIGRIEESALMMMEETDLLREDVRKKDTLFAHMQEALKNHKLVVEEASLASSIQLEDLKSQREQMEKRIPENYMEAFQKAYLLQNIAVSLVEGSSACCGTCRFEIPKRVADAGRKNPKELFFCENCNRILYFSQ